MKFHHIGYLTNNIKVSTNEFKKLNYKKKNGLIKDDILKVQIQFIKNSNNLIELIKPNIKNYGLINLFKKKIYAYHFGYKVKDINKKVKFLKEKFQLIVNPTPAKAFNNKKVAFLKMKNGFIIELIES